MVTPLKTVSAFPGGADMLLRRVAVAAWLVAPGEEPVNWLRGEEKANWRCLTTVTGAGSIRRLASP